MGGVHVCYRWTNTRTYIGAGSKLILPKDYRCILNNEQKVNKKHEVKRWGGAFPEFFHGFYTKKTANDPGPIAYGCDIGIIAYSDGYRIVYWGNPFVSSEGQSKMTSSAIRNIPANRTIMLNSYITKINGIGTLVTNVTTESGGYLDSMNVRLTEGAYNEMITGCYINREMNLVSNAEPKYDPDDSNEKSKKYPLPARAYFRNAKFVETTLTNWWGGYEIFGSATVGKNNLKENVPDADMPDDYMTNFIYDLHPTTTNGFMSDEVSATFFKYDVNFDGVLNQNDFDYAFNHGTYGEPKGTRKWIDAAWAFDVDNDGEVTMADYLLISYRVKQPYDLYDPAPSTGTGAEEVTFTVTYKPGYLADGNTYQVSGLVLGQRYTLLDPEDCGINSGHPFLCWSADDGNSYMIGDEIVITKDITLKADFER